MARGAELAGAAVLAGVLALGALVVCAAVVILAFGGARKGETVDFQKTSSITSDEVAESQGLKPGVVGPRVLAVVPSGVGLAAIVDVESRKFLATRDGGDLRAVEVCDTAARLAGEQRVAVSCGAAGSGRRQVEIWDTASLTRERAVELILANEESGPPARLTDAVVAPSLDLVACAPYGGVVEVFDLADGHSLRALFTGTESHVDSLAFSADSTQLAVGHGDGSVSVFTLDGGRRRRLTPAREEVGSAVAFSADGTHIAAATFWGGFCLWAADGSVVTCDAGARNRYGHYDVTFSPDGRAVQIRGGELILRDHAGVVTGLAFGAAGAARPGVPTGLLGGVQAVTAKGAELVVIDAAAHQATRLRRVD
jgi:hypothetical protein